MLNHITKLYESGRFMAKEVTLGVLPESNVLHLAGYIEFSGASPSHGHKERFQGHESAELKKALREIVGSAENIAILVSTSPCGKPGKETLYHFQVTEHLENAQALDSEIAGLKEKGIISKHTYEVKPPKKPK